MNTTEVAHAKSRRFLGNAYRTASFHAATNLQSTVTAKNAITLLLKEVICIRFDQNPPKEYRRQKKTNVKRSLEMRIQETEIRRSQK
jgi:hypothetical protein